MCILLLTLPSVVYCETKGNSLTRLEFDPLNSYKSGQTEYIQGNIQMLESGAGNYPNFTADCKSLTFAEPIEIEKEQLYLLCTHDSREQCERTLEELASENSFKIINGPKESEASRYLLFCRGSDSWRQYLRLGPVAENPLKNEKLALLILMGIVVLLFGCVIIFAIRFIQTHMDLEKYDRDIEDDVENTVIVHYEERPFDEEVRQWKEAAVNESSSDGVHVNDSTSDGEQRDLSDPDV